jgi:hypothetical protein
MTIDTGQNVGIGTSSPSAQLEVSRAGSSEIRATTTTTSGGNVAVIKVKGPVSNYGIFTVDNANYLAFYDYTAGAERMRIDANGNIGIGTTSIVGSNRLSVVGGGIQLSGGTSAQAGVRVQYASNTATFAGINNDNNAYNALAFSTSASEAMRIDTSGNLQFNSGYGSVAVAYGCRAWVNFNGTGTVAIRGSGNVSSITDNGTGTYTVNLTSALPDTNGVPTVICNRTSYAQSDAASFGSTSALLVSTAANGLAYDQSIIQVTIVR